MDATPEVEARFQADVDRVQKQYGVATGEDVTKFPTFNFQGKPLIIFLLLYLHFTIFMVPTSFSPLHQSQLSHVKQHFIVSNWIYHFNL